MAHQRISVLMGGPSAEHDISLKSGQGIVAALSQRGWEVQPVVIPRDLATPEACRFVRVEMERLQPGVVFIALHGPFGEDGTIQQVCEDLHLPYTGSGVEASRLGLDKVASRARFERAGLSVPRWHVIERTADQGLDQALGLLPFPVVVKPTNQGSSIGVSIATDRASLLHAIVEAFRYDDRILFEEYVQGRELTVGILGTQALPVIEIQSLHQFFDYTAKYTPGQTHYLVPAVLEPQQAAAVQEAGLRAHEALGCRHLSRVDLILDRMNRPVVLEVNTIPGFTATSLLPKAAACIGMTYDELCERLALMAMVSVRPGARV